MKASTNKKRTLQEITKLSEDKESIKYKQKKIERDEVSEEKKEIQTKMV